MLYRRMFQKAGRRYYVHAYLFIAPALSVFLLFRLYPAFNSFVYAFTEVHILKKTATFIGLSNFQELLGDPLFLKSVVNTAVYGITTIPISLFSGLILAYLIHKILRFKNLFKTIYILPVVTSGVASALIWKWLYNPKFGLFNRVLSMAGFPTFRWLHSSREAIVAVILFVIWSRIGLNMLIYLAGLQTIPDSLYESAEIDGAGQIRQFTCVTVPLLRPISTFLLVYNTIQTVRIFEHVWILTGGGPAHSTTVVAIRIFEEAFRNLRFGYASAMALIFFLVFLLIASTQYTLSKRREVKYE